METKYCEFSNEQIEQTKKKMRTKLFFLLLLKDPNPKYVDKYKDINIDDVFEDILLTFGGFNSLLNHPQIMVSILSKIAGARDLVKSDDYQFSTYRKLILSAGNEVLQIGGE